MKGPFVKTLKRPVRNFEIFGLISATTQNIKHPFKGPGKPGLSIIGQVINHIFGSYLRSAPLRSYLPFSLKTNKPSWPPKKQIIKYKGEAEDKDKQKGCFYGEKVKNSFLCSN